MTMTDANRKLLTLILFLPASSLLTRVAGIPGQILHTLANITGLYSLYRLSTYSAMLLQLFFVYLLLLWVLFMVGEEMRNPGPAARQLLDPQLLLKTAGAALAACLIHKLLEMVIRWIPAVGAYLFVLFTTALWAVVPLALLRLLGMPLEYPRADDTSLLRGRGPFIALGIVLVAVVGSMLSILLWGFAYTMYTGGSMLELVDLMTSAPRTGTRHWTHFAVLTALLYPRPGLLSRQSHM